jgi:hypothetical protein
MAFLLLVYPNLQYTDLDLIQKFRKDNDELFYSVVKPNFTIVFQLLTKQKKNFLKPFLKLLLYLTK